MTRTILDIFETDTCSRCGGSGHYSFNQIDGTRCYGCNGRGRRFTKRGAEAKRFYDELRSKRVRDIEVGDLVYSTAYGKFHRVTEIGRDPGDMRFGSRNLGVDYEATEVWGMRTTGVGHAGLDPDKVMVMGQTAEQKAENIAKAVEYQETLTKAGTPRKRQPATTGKE